MRDWFFTIYGMNNAALLVLVVGYAACGLMFGIIWGDTRARREYDRTIESDREYWRSYYSHPSNR